MSIELDRGSCINDIERLHDVLPLAIRFSGNATHIFESDLPERHGCRTLLWVMHRLFTCLDSIIGRQGRVNGLARRYGQLEHLEHWTPLQIIVNGFLTRNPPQTVRGMISKGKDLCNHDWMRLGGQLLTGTRVALQDLF